jgi:hypothetical protein
MGCAVAKSFYEDQIMSMYLQGSSYRFISEWLAVKGAHFIIPASTLSRNLRLASDLRTSTVQQDRDEEIGELGVFDPLDELFGLIQTQRTRVDVMVRQEKEVRQEPGKSRYIDRRVRYEMDVMSRMVRTWSELSPGEKEAEADVETEEASAELRQALESWLVGEDENAGAEEGQGLEENPAFNGTAS